ncbi:hypothetical protein GGI04_003593 [Coemansia thaxteri]|nr:hypothetical protein GGI04_003593 [Coemansia thaxteri]
MEQDAEVSTLMDSLNRLIQQSDEPVAPADSHLQRLEPALQLLDGKLSENGRMLGEALTKINQLTEVLLCQGKLLTQMCARQDASSRDLGVVNAEIKQARLDTAEQLQLIARAQVHFTMQAQANRSNPVPIVAPASAPAPVVAPVLAPAPAPASTPAKSAVILIADTPTTPAASKPGSAVKSAMLPLSLIKAVSPTAVVQPSKSQTNDQTAKPLGQPVPAAKSVIAAKPVAAAAAAAAKLVAPVTRSPSRPRVRSTSRSRARRRRRQSRSRSNPRLYRPRSRSRSSSRSISDSRYVPRPVSRSRNSRDSGDYSADVKLTIKGRTKHQGDDDDDARRPSKYRATSPRVGSAVMFSDEVGSESNSDVDDMIERRIVRSESPDLGSEDRVAVIGIVGASSNKHSPVPHADITSRLGTRLPVYDHCSNSNDDSDHANGDKYSQLISTYSNKHDGLHSTHDEKQMPACLSNQRGSSHGRQELSSWLRDSSGVEITAARLSSVLGPFCYMSLPMISTVYRLCFGCSPMMPGVRLDEYNRALTALEGFRYWPWFKRSSQPGEPLSASIKFIQRDGNEYDRLKERILDRLRITRRGGSVVLGPLLCYYLLMLGCTPTGQLPWPVVDLMFKRVTGLGIASLRVATKDGVQRMSAEDVWIMAKTWVVDLCMFMARGSRMQYSLDMATQCNGVYTDKCRKHGGAHGDDSDGMVAKEMLVQNEEHSQLFLGIRSTELQRLYRYLVCMVGTLVDQSTLKYLKQVSESFLNLSE